MTQTELDMWKARLAHADRYWEACGLSGNPPAEALPVQTVFNAYAGVQWGMAGWGGLPPEDLFQVNVLFSTLNAMMAQVSARNARPIVKPKGKDLASEDSARRALLNEILLQSVAAEMKVKREVDLAISCATQAPFGIVEHVYIPRAEKFDADGNLLDVNHTAKPDFPGVRFRRIRDVRIDPMASSPYPDGDARWVAFRDTYLIEEVRANPRFVNRDDLRPTTSNEWREAQPNALQSNEPPDWMNLVEVWRFYDAVERKCFSLSPGCQKEIEAQRDWPISWESLPYDVLFFHPRVDQMMPVSPASQIVSLQMELNKCRTLMAALTKRLRRIVLVSKDAMEDGEFEKMASAQQLAEFFAGKSGADIGKMVHEVQVGGFPQELLLYHDRIVSDIREVLGVSNMDRAQRINVESGTEAAGVREGAAVLRSPKQERVEEFWSNIYRKMHRGIQQTQNDAVFVPVFDVVDRSILGDYGGGMGFEMPAQDILGEFEYGVQAGSTLPENPEAELAKALALYQTFSKEMMISKRELLRAVLEAARKDPQRWIVTTPAEQGQNLGDFALTGVGQDLSAPMPGANGAARGSSGGKQNDFNPQLLQSLGGSLGGEAA